MRCKQILQFFAALFFLELGFAEVGYFQSWAGQRQKLRGTMKLKKGDHEANCRNFPDCQFRGWLPKGRRSALCPGCTPAGKWSHFRSTKTEEELQASRVEAGKRNGELIMDKSAKKHRAIAAEHPLSSFWDRAAYHEWLLDLIKTPVAAGEAFTHMRLGVSLICLCNCGIIKNCAEYPPQVVIAMLFLLGSFPMRIGDVVGLPVETLVRAAYVAKQLDEKFPGEVDPRAVVPWSALSYEGREHFPKYIREGQKDSEASNYDKAKNPTRVRRVSIMSHSAPPLPPALLRVGKGKDAVGIVRHGVVNSSGRVLVAFPVMIDGSPDVIELLMHRRQATLRDILKWTAADYAAFIALLKPETIKQVVDTKFDGTRAMQQIECFYRAYKLAFEAVHAALLAQFKGKMPPVKALAGFLNAARYEIPAFGQQKLPSDDAKEDDIAAMGRALEGMAKEVSTRAENRRIDCVALDAVDACAAARRRRRGPKFPRRS